MPRAFGIKSCASSFIYSKRGLHKSINITGKSKAKFCKMSHNIYLKIISKLLQPGFFLRDVSREEHAWFSRKKKILRGNNDCRYMKIIYVHCGEETNIRDPRSYEHYWTSSWNKTWKKFRPYGIWIHDLCDLRVSQLKGNFFVYLWFVENGISDEWVCE